MGQLPEDAPFKAAHSSRNRARRMKAARTEARRLVGDALRQRDSALAELSSVKDQLTEANRTHERERAEFKLRTAELAAKAEAASENAASSHEAENLRRVNAETLESLESERRKTQSLMTRLGELNAQVEGERTEKEEFRQEILGLRSKTENASGLSKDEVNGLVARAQAAEERSSELSQNMATLQNQAVDYERQLKEARDDYERLMRVSREELKKRKGELGEIYDLHEGELETNRELRKDNAALTDSIAKAKAELETVSAERDELQKRLADSSTRVEELESSLDAEREGACRLRDSEQENTGKLNDLVQEKEAIARSLAQTQKARADTVAALSAAQEKNKLIQADLQAAREESYRQRHDLEQKLGELERGNARIHEQARAAQSKYDKSTAEYESKINELQKALDSKQLELDRAASDSHQSELESLKKAVESERERADRAEGKARAAELLQEDLETFKGKVSALRRQLAVCSSLKDDLADAETKLADATARASDAESRARAAERDSGRLSRELERVNLKLAEESSRAEGAKAALYDADGVRSLALPCGLLPGEETTVALGSGFQKFRVQKIVYKSDGTIFLENERGQSVPMGTWR
jgi:chromosome segregation ATPase